MCFICDVSHNTHGSSTESKESKDRMMIVMAGCGILRCVEYLLNLEDGANVCAEWNYAIKWASYNGHLEVVKVLCQNGADIHDERDLPVIVWASERGHLHIVKYLVSEGADVRVCNDMAVKLACKHGHIKLVKYLVSQGVDVRSVINSLKFADKISHRMLSQYIEMVKKRN
jgi:hypothetical protein